jgi:hypothetical protein
MITLFKKQKSTEPTFLEQKPKLRTVIAAERLPFNDWARKYRVSSCFERVRVIYRDRPEWL